MADITYLVDIELRSHGDLGASLKDAKGGVDSLSGAFRDFGADASSAFTGIVESAGQFLETTAKIAGAAGLGLAVYGVMALNKELEVTKYSIAAIQTAAGRVGEFKDALAPADQIMDRLRKNAATLPGTFQELIGIYRTIATPALASGMDEKRLEDMASKAMAAGTVMGLGSDTVGRSLARAMEGNVGSRNIFATRLGIGAGEAKAFKGLSPEKRIEALEKALGKYSGATAAFADTFQAKWTTATDNAKKFLGTTTLPLFGVLKNELGNFNKWFDENQGLVSQWSHKIGSFLVDSFMAGKAIFLEYGPLLLEFGENAYAKFMSIWVDMKPYIDSLGDTLKEALKDPGTLDKIITALKLYAAVKIGGGLSSAFGGIAKAGFGNAGAVLGAGAGGVAAEGGLAGLAVSAASAGVALLALAEVAGVAYLLYRLHKEYGEAIQESSSIMHNYTDVTVRGLRAWNKGAQEIDMGGKAYQRALEDAGASSHTWVDSVVETIPGLNRLTDTSGQAAQALLSLSVAADNASAAFHKDEDPGGKNYHPLEGIPIGLLNVFNAAHPKAEPKKAGVPGGSGNTNMFITMTISSNQAPGQIARRVVDELARMRRDPKASPNAPNYSAR